MRYTLAWKQQKSIMEMDTLMTWNITNDFSKKNFSKLPEEKIKSNGYVVDTLEAALWCLLNTDNYKDCVLKAVNLGDDTDTVAAIAGGLAGMFYGVDAIPNEWLEQLVWRDYTATRHHCPFFRPLTLTLSQRERGRCFGNPKTFNLWRGAVYIENFCEDFYRSLCKSGGKNSPFLTEKKWKSQRCFLCVLSRLP